MNTYYLQKYVLTNGWNLIVKALLTLQSLCDP